MATIRTLQSMQRWLSSGPLTKLFGSEESVLCARTWQNDVSRGRSTPGDSQAALRLLDKMAPTQRAIF